MCVCVALVLVRSVLSKFFIFSFPFLDPSLHPLVSTSDSFDSLLSDAKRPFLFGRNHQGKKNREKAMV